MRNGGAYSGQTFSIPPERRTAAYDCSAKSHMGELGAQSLSKAPDVPLFLMLIGLRRNSLELSYQSYWLHLQRATLSNSQVEEGAAAGQPRTSIHCVDTVEIYAENSQLPMSPRERASWDAPLGISPRV